MLTAVVAALALAVSGISLAWQVHTWVRNGPRVEIEMTTYGPDEIPDADKTYPKAGLLVTVQNRGRAETNVGNPLLHTGIEPRLKETVLPGGPWLHIGNGKENYFPIGAMASYEYPLSYLMAFTPWKESFKKNKPLSRNFRIEVVTGHGRFDIRLPRKVQKKVQGWADQCMR